MGNGYDPLYDLDVDEQGRVYVAGLNAVTVLDVDGSDLTLWEEPGVKDMTSVALGGGRLGYVMNGDRVYAFTRGGELVTQWITRFAVHIAVQGDDVEGGSWGRIKARYGE